MRQVPQNPAPMRIPAKPSLTGERELFQGGCHANSILVGPCDVVGRHRCWRHVVRLGGVVERLLGPSAAPSRLAALAARQDLCDEVAVATAKGRLTNDDRIEILADAKSILKPEEYQTFKRSLDRRWPPAQKKPTAKHSPKTARKATGPSQPAQAKPPAGPSLGLVIPAGALLPDWVVPRGVSR